jgi:hypothetical protein
MVGSIVMELVCKSIPIEIAHNIKAYGPIDSWRYSHTARCIDVLLEDYIKTLNLSEEDIRENDGDLMCLSIEHFRRYCFHEIGRDRWWKRLGHNARWGADIWADWKKPNAIYT